MAQLGTHTDSSRLTVHARETDENWLLGAYVGDTSTLNIARSQGHAQTGPAIASVAGVGPDLETLWPQLIAADVEATSGDGQGWSLGGQHDTVDRPRGNGMEVVGDRCTVTAVAFTGAVNAEMLSVTGTNNQVHGGHITGTGEVAIYASGPCNRVTGITIPAVDPADLAAGNWTDVVVRADNGATVDAIHSCGPGWFARITYGCNEDFPPDVNECVFCEECTACDNGIPTVIDCEAPGACDPPTGARDPDNCEVCSDDADAAYCLNEACWPDPEDMLPQLIGSCLEAAAWWDVENIRTTKVATLGFPDTTAGQRSESWTPDGHDCVAAVEVSVLASPVCAGDTVVDVYRDDTMLGTITVPAGSGTEQLWVSAGVGASADPERFYGVIQSLTVPDVGDPDPFAIPVVILRFP